MKNYLLYRGQIIHLGLLTQAILSPINTCPMTNFSCLIVEDNEVDLLTLKTLLAQVPFLSQIDCCSTAMDALARLGSTKYDLVFLDICLPDMSGMDFLRDLPYRPPIIVCSAHVQFAEPCYDLTIADFLLKPFERSRLMRAINRALTISLNDRSLTYSHGIFLHTARRLQQFLFTDIKYIEAHGAYSKIYSGNEVVTVNDSISWIESQLPPGQFVRIQKSFIINLTQITAIEARNIWLGGTKLSVGQQYRDQLRQFVGNFADK